MDWNQIDWPALERLRGAFLEGSAGHQDYWTKQSDLASYDLTFAQRIGWKWDYVLQELSSRHWTPPPGEILDWGCGSGIASRAFLDQFGPESVSSLRLSDRSKLAVQFASNRAQAKFPHLRVLPDETIRCAPATLLLSHVLTELNAEQAEVLMRLAEQATAILWVEPGTQEASRRLSAFRDRLRSRFQVVAPCTHQSACPMLQAQNAGQWCHHFATPPATVFTDRNWARFASLAGIDPRSLPLSFLVLDQRPPGPMPAGAARIIGRPRLYKGHALVLGCDGSGLHERRLSKRFLSEPFRQIRKARLEPVQLWECDDDEIIQTRPYVPESPGARLADASERSKKADKFPGSVYTGRDMNEGPKQMRQLLAKPGIIRSLGAHDVFSALIVEQAGFETVFIGGFGTSASLLGLPDLNFLTQSEMADAVRRMAARVRIPVIADGDTGHGDLPQVQRTIELFESGGAAGILLEDQVSPKRCGHFADKQVIPTAEMVLKIKAAVQARAKPDFLIFARTDARQMNGLDDAIDRVNRCCDAGADIAFIEAPQSLAELEEIPRRVPHPLFVNMLSGGVTPILPVAQLEQLGYKIVVCPIESLLVCARALRELCETWKTEGRVDRLAAKAMSFAEVKELLRVDDYLEVRQRVSVGGSSAGGG